MKGPLDLRHYDEWTDADGDVLWWVAPIGQDSIPFFGVPCEDEFDRLFKGFYHRLVWLPCPKPNTDGKELMKEKQS